MRFQDWDVLLFPENCHVPFKEFRTACYAIETPPEDGGVGIGDDKQATPLLTSFTPAVPYGSHFTISVHAWNNTLHPAMLGGDTTYKKFYWQVRVIVDGVAVTTKRFPALCTWPQIISSDDNSNAYQSLGQPLKWPLFPRSAMTEREWDIASDAGRIKIELSSGFTVQIADQIVHDKLATVVCFSFFPAPIDLLEQKAIAWPNATIIKNALPASRTQTPSRTISDAMPHHLHTRNVSHGSMHLSSPMRSLPQPPPPTPVLGMQYQHLQTVDAHSNYDLDSSRSTSGYSNGIDITSSMPFGTTQNYSQTKESEASFRLPDDQMQRLIDVFVNRQQEALEAARAMPPPPLPRRASMAKSEAEAGNLGFVTQTLASPIAVNDATRRGESRDSDISMHAACTSFPACIEENDRGQMVHSSPAAPSTVIKGKKEGSSPDKHRDYMSTILTPHSPAQEQIISNQPEPSSFTSSSPGSSIARKRTRSALRNLNINDGSPEKKDSTRKPARKSSRSSSTSTPAKVAKMTCDVVNLDPSEDKENMMSVD